MKIISFFSIALFLLAFFMQCGTQEEIILKENPETLNNYQPVATQLDNSVLHDLNNQLFNYHPNARTSQYIGTSTVNWDWVLSIPNQDSSVVIVSVEILPETFDGTIRNLVGVYEGDELIDTYFQELQPSDDYLSSLINSQLTSLTKFKYLENFSGRLILKNLNGEVFDEYALRNSDASAKSAITTYNLDDVVVVTAKKYDEEYCKCVDPETYTWSYEDHSNYDNSSEFNYSGGGVSSSGTTIPVTTNRETIELVELLIDLAKVNNCDKLSSTHGEELRDQWDFYEENQNVPKEEIVFQRENRSITDFDSQLGGPNIRYISDPLNPNIIIDLRHMLIIGEHGRSTGESVEFIQWLGQNESAFDNQDYYSNELGYLFYEKYGEAISFNPEGLADYLITFLNDETMRNSSCDPNNCK
ncbi:MAG: hypothetical protein JXR07_06975 [Reichenbachiella sp.]